jgi:hypothetical protein
MYGIADSGMTIKNLAGSKTNFSEEIRSNNIQSVKGIIRESFQRRTGTDPVRDCWTTELQNILMQSSTEDSSYDFKIGFCNLDQQSEFNQEVVTGIIQTLLGIANRQPGNAGYVVIGIADNVKDAERHNQIYGAEAIKYQNFYITGMQDEAKKASKDDDSYYRMIRQKIESQPIPEEVKSEILRNMRFVSYYGKQVLVLKIQSGKRPYLFDEEHYFERHGSNTVKGSMALYTNAVERFILESRSAEI